MGYGDYGMNMRWFGWIGMLAFWLLVIIVVVLLIRWIIVSLNRGAGGAKGPLDILKKRYAKGEITKEEFEEKKKDLG